MFFHNSYHNTVDNIFGLELHLYIGNVNKIVDSLNVETEILKRNGLLHLTLYQWLHQSPRNVVHEDYYGSMLNGPNCDKVLKRQTLMDMYDFLPPELHKYVLRAFDTLKKITEV